MPDSKNLNWVGEYTDANSSTNRRNDAVSPAQPAANDAQPAANDNDGWQQYRRWISKAPAPKERRVGIDPALCTWKGYRNWTEQVRREWTDGDDSD
jgi:hypothetical protein